MLDVRSTIQFMQMILDEVEYFCFGSSYANVITNYNQEVSNERDTERA